MQVRFVVVSRSGQERVIARPLPLLVGRDEQAGLRLPRDSVSRRHCEFLCRDGGVVVRDLGSTNGTLLGTQPIDHHVDVPVAAGSVLTIGGIRLRIEYDAPAADDPPTEAAGAPAALADVEAVEDPAAAGDFGFLAAEPAAAAPPADWPEVAAPAPPPDDDDLNDFFKSLS